MPQDSINPPSRKGRVSRHGRNRKLWHERAFRRLLMEPLESRRVLDAAVFLDEFNDLTIESLDGSHDHLTFQADQISGEFVVTENTGAPLWLGVPNSTGDGTNAVRIPFSEVPGSRLNIRTTGEGDLIDLDNSLGPISLAVSVNGGAQGFDILTVKGRIDLAHFVTVTPGTGGKQGEVAFDEMLVEYDEIELVTIDVGGGAGADFIQIHGTHGDDSASVRSLGGLTEVTISQLTPIQVTNATPGSTLAVDTLDGSDVISLSVFDGLGAAATDYSFEITGGSPVGSDTLVIEGSAAPNTIIYTPHATDNEAGSLIIDGVAASFTGAEHLSVNGMAGIDRLTISESRGGAGPITIAPSGLHSGTVRAKSSSPIDYRGVELPTLISSQPITAQVYGTAGDDTANIEFSDIDGDTTNESIVALNENTIDITGMHAIDLQLLGGQDTITVNVDTANIALPGDLKVHAGGNEGDTLVVAGTTAAENITADLANGTVIGAINGVISIAGIHRLTIDSGGTAADNVDVAGIGIDSGVRTVSVDLGDVAGATLDITGTDVADRITYEPQTDVSGVVTSAQTNLRFDGLLGDVTLTPLGGNDTVQVQGDAATNAVVVALAAITTVTIDSLKPIQVLAADTESLVVAGGLGRDSFQLSGSGGPSLTIDGQGPLDDPLSSLFAPPGDSLQVTGSNMIVTHGQTNDSGSITSGSDITHFQGLESVSLNLVGGGALSAGVIATDADNAISYSDPSGNDSFSVVTVDEHVPVFLTKDSPVNLTILGLEGDDVIEVRPVTITDITLTVDAGGPSASDKIVFAGDLGDNMFIYQPDGAQADKGTVSVTTTLPTGPNTFLTTFSQTETVIIDGKEGTDSVTMSEATVPLGQTSNDTVLYRQATNGDSHYQWNSSSPVVLQQVETRFLNLGLGEDRLDVFGDENSNVLGVVEVAGFTGVTVDGAATLLLHDPTVPDDLNFRPGEGIDAVLVQGRPSLDVGVLGAGMDHVSYLSNGGGANIGLEIGNAKITESGFGAVTFVGIATVSISGAGTSPNPNARLTVDGSSFDDLMTYTPLSVDGGRIELALPNPAYSFSSIDRLVVEPLAGQDTVRVQADDTDNTIGVTRGFVPSAAPGIFTKVDVSGRLPIEISQSTAETVEVLGGLGTDNFFVTGGGGPDLTIDGQGPQDDPLGLTNMVPTGDTLSVTGSALTVTHGQTNDSGSIDSSGDLLRFTGIESAELNLVGASVIATIHGTDADNAIGYSDPVGDGSVSLVTVDEHVPVYLNSDSTIALAILAHEGDDVINVRGATISNVLLAIDAGPPSASDTVIVTGDATDNAFTYTPHATQHSSGVVTIASLSIAFHNTESLVLDGLEGSDSLTAKTADNIDDHVLLTPLGRTESEFQFNSSTAVTVARIENVTFDTMDKFDVLTVQGSPDRDEIVLKKTEVTLNGQRFALANVEFVSANLGEGNDRASVMPDATAGFEIHGGDAAGDLLFFHGRSGPVTIDTDDPVNLNDFQITQDATRPLGGTGIELVIVDAQGDLTVNGSPANNVFTWQPTGESSGTLQRSELGTAFELRNANSLTIDPGDGLDETVVLGTAKADQIRVGGSPAQVTVNRLLTSQLADSTESLVVDAGLGDDVVRVDGATEAAVRVRGGTRLTNDRLIVEKSTGNDEFRVVPGTELDAGLVEVGRYSVDFEQIEHVTLDGRSSATRAIIEATDAANEVAVEYAARRDSTPLTSVQLVSRNLTGSSTGAASVQQGSSFRAPIFLSGNGRYVAYEDPESADKVVPGTPADVNQGQDVFVRDLVTGAVQLVSVNHGGTGTGDKKSSLAEISDDGRFVLFTSQATDLVGGITPTAPATQIYLRDLLLQTTRLISANLQGTVSNGENSRAMLTPDGRFVVFESKANNLTGLQDNNGVEDVFVRDVAQGVTVAVSVTPAGNAMGSAASINPQISDNGGFVVWTSKSTNLASGISGATTEEQVYWRGLAGQTTQLVSVGSGSVFGNGRSIQPDISADGQVVIWASEADNLNNALQPGATSGPFNVFARDMRSQITELISTAAQTAAFPRGGANIAAVNPMITPEGRFVLFDSSATNLSALPTFQAQGRNVYLADRQTGKHTPVNVNDAGTHLAGDISRDSDPVSSGAGISDDGRYVHFISDAPDVVSSYVFSTDSNGTFDLYRRDMLQRKTTLVSADAFGREGSGPTPPEEMIAIGNGLGFSNTVGGLVRGAVSVSNDGEVAAFSTSAADLDEPGIVGESGPDDNQHDDFYAAARRFPLVTVDDRFDIRLDGFVGGSELSLETKEGDDRIRVAMPDLQDLVIRVNGGGPAASDQLVVEGSVLNDTFTYTPDRTYPEQGGITYAGFLNTMVTGTLEFSNVEAITIDGHEDSDFGSMVRDKITFVGARNQFDRVELHPLGHNESLVRANASSPLRLENIEDVDFDMSNPDGFAPDDLLVVHGTSNDDDFDSTDGSVSLNGQSFSFTDFADVTAYLGAGADISNVHARLVKYDVQGGSSDDDRLSVAGISDDAQLLHGEIRVAGMVAHTFSDIEHFSLDAGGTAGSTITVEATEGDDVVNVESLGTVQSSTYVGLRPELVSVNQQGKAGSGVSNKVIISGNGKFVAFQNETPAGAIVQGIMENNVNASDVFVRDLASGRTEVISLNTAGTGTGDARAFLRNISDDGRFVLFESGASNLVANVTGRQVYLRDRDLNTTTLISRGPQGAGDGTSGLSSMTPDGTLVVFHSRATNLTTFVDNNGVDDVFLHDVAMGTTTPVSVSQASATTLGNDDSRHARISDNGKFVVWTSDATNLVASSVATSSPAEQVFHRDLAQGMTTLVSQTSSGKFANAAAENVQISANGQFVLWQSRASDLVSGDTNNALDVFLADATSSTRVAVSRISQTPAGVAGNSHSGNPIMTPDAQFVAFDSKASNLSSLAISQNQNTFVFDRSARTLELVSISMNGAAHGQSFLGALSDDGRIVVYASRSHFVLPSDTDRDTDLFVRDRDHRMTSLLSINERGVASGDADTPPFVSTGGLLDIAFRDDISVSNDGLATAFISAASNLVPTGIDSNQEGDVYLVKPGKLGEAFVAVDDEFDVHLSGFGNDTTLRVQTLDGRDTIRIAPDELQNFRLVADAGSGATENRLIVDGTPGADSFLFARGVTTDSGRVEVNLVPTEFSGVASVAIHGREGRDAVAAQGASSRCATIAATLVNPSFETPRLGQSGVSAAMTTGWTIQGNAGVFRNSSLFLRQLDDGDQAAFSEGGNLLQELAETLSPGVEYELTVAVGSRVDKKFSNYRIELLAGSTVLAATDQTSSVPAKGQFVDAQISFTPSATHPQLGQRISVRLSATSPDMAVFDNVRLAVVPRNPTCANDVASLEPLGNGESRLRFGDSTRVKLFGIDDVAIDTQGGFDTLGVQATGNNDVASLKQNEVVVNGQKYVVANSELVIANLGDGDDRITVTPHAITGFVIHGGDPSHSDFLTFDTAGDLGFLTIDTEDRVNGNDGQILEGGKRAVGFTGIEHVIVPAMNSDVTVNGTDSDDFVTYEPTGEDSGTLERDGLNVRFLLTDVDDLSVDLLGERDTLVVHGTTAGETISVGSTSVDVAGRQPVDYANTEALILQARQGADEIRVVPGSIPVFVDGGDPIGNGDTLNVVHANATLVNGPETDEGAVSFPTAAPISFDHIEAIAINGQLTRVTRHPLPSPRGNTLTQSSDTGRSRLDTITGDNTPSFVVQADIGLLEAAGFVADPGAADGGLIVETQAIHATTGQTTSVRPRRLGQTSLWTGDFTAPLTDGQYFLTSFVAVRNANGDILDRGMASEPMLMIIDTQNPAGASGEAEGGVFTKGSPTFSGEGERGAIIRALAGGRVLGETEVGDQGRWTMEIQTPLADGQLDVIFQSEDVAGNVDDGASNPLRILVDDDQILSLAVGQFQFLVEGDQLVLRKGDEELFRLPAAALGDLRVHAAATQIGLEFRGDWTLPQTTVRNSVFYRVLEVAGARLLLHGPSNWQNPLDHNDVNNNGLIVEPVGDILRLINEINSPTIIQADGRLPDFPTAPNPAFFDVNGDGFLTPVGDILAQINLANRQANDGEGEANGSTSEAFHIRTAIQGVEAHAVSWALQEALHDAESNGRFQGNWQSGGTPHEDVRVRRKWAPDTYFAALGGQDSRHERGKKRTEVKLNSHQQHDGSLEDFADELLTWQL